VSGVELSFPVVQLAFRIFDNDGSVLLFSSFFISTRTAFNSLLHETFWHEGNGTLDQSELVKVLEMRTDIALKKKHPETFVKRFITCIKEGSQH
jgi:hypothetical protein